MAGVGSAAIAADKWLTLYNAVIQAMGSGAVGGFGTDMNGMEFGMPPRPGSSVKYGTKRFTLRIRKDGTKSWDYNVIGVAHYGLIPTSYRTSRRCRAMPTLSEVSTKVRNTFMRLGGCLRGAIA